MEFHGSEAPRSADDADLLAALPEDCDECDSRLSLLQLTVAQKTNSSDATEQAQGMVSTDIDSA